MPTLKNRVFRAGTWTIASHGVSQAIRMASNLVMTRLMFPGMFGVMSIATMFIVGLALFSDIGLRQSIIQSRRGEEADFLNTAWVTQILRSALISVLALLLGLCLYIAQKQGWTPVGSVYGDPTLPSIVAVLALSALIAGFESTKFVEAARKLELGRIAFLEIGGQLFGVVVMITWAFLSRTIWALVAGGIAAAVLRVYLTHTIFSGVKNRWHWDSDAFKEIIGMGKWIFLSSILYFILNSGDRILLGAMVSSEMLGIYSIAFMILGVFDQGIRKMISNVCYSAITEVVRASTNDPDRLREFYYKFTVPIDAILLFLSGLFFTCGSYIINLLYDSRYHDAGWMLQILSFSLIGIRYEIANCCYLALGKPGHWTAIICARFFGFYISVPIAFYFFGLHGALWAISLSFLSGAPLVFYFNYQYKILDWKREFFTLPALALGGGTGKLLMWVLGAGFVLR